MCIISIVSRCVFSALRTAKTTVADVAKDFVVEQHGVQVAVDKKSDLYLDGTTVDFHNGIDKRGFTFENPNVTKSCGCGSSFGM